MNAFIYLSINIALPLCVNQLIKVRRKYARQLFEKSFKNIYNFVVVGQLILVVACRFVIFIMD